MNGKNPYLPVDENLLSPIISVVIPTRNEAGNIEPLLCRISAATVGIPTEVLFVDDSTDDTTHVIQSLQGKYPVRVNLIARPPERRKNGLGGAVVEGMSMARGPWVCVMDADLQHPPELIPQIFRHTEATKSDIVVGSRLAPGGDTSGLGFNRTIISWAFALTTRMAFPVRLKKVTDPLSGFFIVRKSALDLDHLRPDGFKILLEILVQHPLMKVSEIPIHFGHRLAGDSKASIRETIRFFRLLLRLRLANSQSFIRFLTVGASGIVVNTLALAFFTELTGLHYLIAAIVATQVSTLWNFGLTERWVFKKRGAVDLSFFQRLVNFMLLNNFALLLRGPLLSLMVMQLGMHYLVANVFSLALMTLVRYTVSDKWIWKNDGLPVRSTNSQNLRRRFPQMTSSPAKNTDTAKSAASMTLKPQADKFKFSYNIHNILQIASMFQLPELEYFRVSGPIENPDIRLRLERRYKDRRRKKSAEAQSSLDLESQRRSQRRFEDLIHYQESLGRLGFEVSIAYKDCAEVAVSPILRFSRHVLYTNIVEPILRWALVRKGYALVHAACISSGDRAVLITARTDTGKTSTILRAVENYACSFLSDDMTILSREGLVLSYPKPLTISSHTLHAVNGGYASLSLLERIALQIQSRLHSKTGRGIGMKLSETLLPAATLNTIVQMLIPPPKYMVHRLIPSVSYADHATLSRAVIIERGTELVEVLQHAQAVETFVRNAEDAYGFPPYPMLADALSTWEKKDLHPKEQAIVSEALKRVSVIRLRDPKFNWWQRLPVIAKKTPSTAIPFAADD